MSKSGLWLVAAAMVSTSVCEASPSVEPERNRDLPKLSSSVVIDGVLDEPVWKDALQVDKFYEITPGDNTSAVVQTVGYIWYDERALYVAFRCFDPHPESIRAIFSERDAVTSDQDLVQFDLDTRNEEKSSYIFRTNPRGIQADAIFSEATGLDDYSPDFSFAVGARIVEDGWTAEFRIPFSSVRYDRDIRQWGITLFRNYPRDYRRQMTSLPIPRGANCWLCYNLKLNGLTNLPASRNLLVVPYATLQDSDGGNSKAVDANTGVDIKWVPNNNITIDATLNPDFSQVESDVPTIAVNKQFALFYPEKRSFFLEGADLPLTPLNAVYTRTITSPAWGARVTGQAGRSSYMFLATEDDGGGSKIIPGPISSTLVPQNETSMTVIGRWRTTLGNSFAGFVATDRESDSGFNRLMGPDLQWRPKETHQLNGQLLISSTRDKTLAPDAGTSSDSALLLRYRYRSPSSGIQFDYQKLGHDFRAENGFIPQVGIERKAITVLKNYYPDHWLTLIEPGFTADSTGEIDNRTVSRSTYPYLSLNGKWNSSLLFQYHAREQLRTGARLLEYNYVHFQIELKPSQRFSSLALSGQVGEQADVANERIGRGGILSLNASFRPGSHLATDIRAERQWLNIGKNRLFTADVAQLKATYNFSSRMFLRFVGQYSQVNRNPLLYSEPVQKMEGYWGTTILYGYRFNWQTAIYVGYSNERVLENDTWYQPGTNHFFIKYAYAIEH